MTRSLIAFLSLLFLSGVLFAQDSNLFIDTSYTVDEMVDAFFEDSDVLTSNVSHTGAPLSISFFDAGDTDMDINAGIFLATGNVTQAANTAAFFASTSFAAPGDVDLEMQVDDGYSSFDASVLEMDITPFTDTICFFYVFASEEYPEWVFTQFNDVFAFFISGGPEYDTLTNIASIPETDPPVAVSINTVNQFLFSNFYIPQYTGGNTPDEPIDYFDNTDLAYDGMTTLLPAKAAVTPGETYHIKIGITDVSDGIFDSGVFIGIESLGGDSLLTPIANATLSVEGNSIIIENESMFAKEFEWDFGDGTISEERHPGIHEYEEAGTYEVNLTVSSWCCSATYTEVVEVGETQVLSANFGANNNIVCEGASINFQDLSLGNVVAWEWSFPGGEPAASTEAAPAVNYPENGVYDVSLVVTDESGQSAGITGQDFVTINPIPVANFELSSTNELTISLANNSEFADSYLWDFGDGNQSMLTQPTHTYEMAGNYVITLTALNDCGEAIDEEEISLVINNTEDLSLNRIQLYPNPVTDGLLYIQNDLAERYAIAIFSLDGKQLLQKENLLGHTPLNLNQLSKGTYIVKLVSTSDVISHLIDIK
jgi:PKD repeat protein